MSKRTRIFREYRGETVDDTRINIVNSIVPRLRSAQKPNEPKYSTAPMKNEKALRIAYAIHRTKK